MALYTIPRVLHAGSWKETNTNLDISHNVLPEAEISPHRRRLREMNVAGRGRVCFVSSFRSMHFFITKSNRIDSRSQFFGRFLTFSKSQPNSVVTCGFRLVLHSSSFALLLYRTPVLSRSSYTYRVLHCCMAGCVGPRLALSCRVSG